MGIGSVGFSYLCVCVCDVYQDCEKTICDCYPFCFTDNLVLFGKAP